MASLHAGRWGLGAELYRQTRDADLGIPTSVAKDPWVVQALEDAGYRRAAGKSVRANDRGHPNCHRVGGRTAPGRPIRSRHRHPRACLPIQSPRQREIGEHLTTTEVRGLAFAFNHPAVRLDLEMARLNGEALRATVALPDEASTVVLRAFAWHVRGSDTDAVDLWRSLEIAHAAAVGPDRFEKAEAPEAAEIARRAFG